MPLSAHSKDMSLISHSKHMPLSSHYDQPRLFNNIIYSPKTTFLKVSKYYRLVTLLWGHAIERSQWSHTIKRSQWSI